MPSGMLADECYQAEIDAYLDYLESEELAESWEQEDKDMREYAADSYADDVLGMEQQS